MVEEEGGEALREGGLSKGGGGEGGPTGQKEDVLFELGLEVKREGGGEGGRRAGGEGGGRGWGE